MDAHGHAAGGLGKWPGHAPREIPLGEAPDWASTPTRRPAHELGLEARLRQERIVPLDSYEIRSTRTQVSIVAHLPGVKPSEVSLSVDPGLVTISSEIVDDGEDSAHGALWQICREGRRERVSQTLPIPPGLAVDTWAATFEESVLRLTIPRRR